MVYVGIGIYAHAHPPALVYLRAYDALYPRYRSCDGTIMQEIMDEIYRAPKSDITNLVKVGVEQRATVTESNELSYVFIGRRKRYFLF